MNFHGIRLLLFVISCVTVAVSMSIRATSNSVVPVKQSHVACYGRRIPQVPPTGSTTTGSTGSGQNGGDATGTAAAASNPVAAMTSMMATIPSAITSAMGNMMGNMMTPAGK